MGVVPPGLAPLARVAGYISLQSEICSRSGHEGYQIVWVNKLIPETRVGFRIENLFEPIDDDLVPIRVAKLFVISKPKLGMMTNAHVDGDQWRTQGDRTGWQETHSCSPFHRIQNADAGVCLYSDNAFQRGQPENSSISGIVHLRRVLLDNSVTFELRQRCRNSVEFLVPFGNKGINVESAEFRDDKVRICRRFELDGNVRFKPRDVRLLHCAAKIDGDLSIGLLEVDQSRKNPEIAWPLGRGDAHRTRRITR